MRLTYTIKDLKGDIEDLPDDMEILLQTDPEGNGYEYIRGIDPECVILEEGYRPEVISTEFTSSEADIDEDEWDEILKRTKVAVIFP